MTLWKVKFVYSVLIEAESRGEAHKLVCKTIKDAPHSVISAVEDAKYSNQRPVWRRLLTGR
jgi:hypothetical protein